MKSVLVLNGSFCEIPLIEECHRLGYYVYTTGNMPQLMGHRFADEYICADYSDYKAILEIVRTKKIDHIITCANDFGSITAAYVDEQMGWCHHDTYQNALMMHHKDLFKAYMMQKGFPTPTSHVFTDKAATGAYIETLSDADFPVIVKANDLTGGKGIVRAGTKEAAWAAIDVAFGKSRSKHILVEKFVEGDQQTFVAFLHHRKVVSSMGCDSLSYVNPYLIQLETLPSTGLDLVREKLTTIIETMADDLKLADGIFAVQYVKNGADVSIFEMMRRPFGNQFLKLVEYCTDFPWHRAQIIAETGGDWSQITRKPIDHAYCGHFGVMVKRNGLITGIEIPEDIRSHVIEDFPMKSLGQEIKDYLNERVTYLHFAYDSQEEMIRETRRYFDRIKVDIA